MNLGMDFRGAIKSLPTKLESLAGRINVVWKKQHNDAGGHTDVTATTVTSDDLLVGRYTGPRASYTGHENLRVLSARAPALPLMWLAASIYDIEIVSDQNARILGNLISLQASSSGVSLSLGGVPGAQLTGLLTLNTGQINFPAAQNPSANANTLDDYEEGLSGTSWLPDLRFGGAAAGMTYASRGGAYVKVGRKVTAWWDFILSAKGASVGNATILGLPFAQAAIAGHIPVGTALKGAMAAGFAGNCIPWLAADIINLYQSGAGGDVPVADPVFTNTSRIFGQITYIASA